MTSLADKLRDLELCLKSHGQIIGYRRALRATILSMDVFMEVEVLKSIGDLHLQKGKRNKDSAEFDKAATLYAAALLRCTDPDMGQTLEHRVSYLEKLPRKLLQGYTPSEYWGATDGNVVRVAKICGKIDRRVGKLRHSLEETYTETLVTALETGDVFLELEVMKSLGDLYLEKGKKTSDLSQFSKAAAMYGKAMTRCKDPETKETLQHRVLYMVKIWRAGRRHPPAKRSRPKGKRSPMGTNRRTDVTRGHHLLPGLPRVSTGKENTGLVHTSDKTQEDTNSTYEEHMQKGSRALETGDLDKAEQEFAAALKSVHVKYSKSDKHCKEAEPLYKLSNVFLKRGIQSKDGGDFTKAAALCNAALVRSRREDRTEAIQEISHAFCKHVLNIEEMVDIGDTKKHKLMLKENRNNVKEEIKRIEQEVDPYSLADGDPEMREIEKMRAEEIKALFETIVQQRKVFITGLVDECIEVMGSPPCEYAMIGLGSQATGLVTPYSDLEFAILVKEETENNVRYFRNLTHFLHLKVIYLGETILPAMGIRSLNDFYSDDPLDNWFYDSVTPRGFAFDGAMPHACKTPLGRGRSSISTSELIHTPTEMTKVLDEDLTFHLKKGYHLASILGNVCLITREQDLVEEYLTLWTKRQQGNYPGLVRSQLAITHIIDNAPIFKREFLPATLMNVKKDMYRFSSLAVSCLALLHKIAPTTIWETIDDLDKNGVINSENAHHLMVMVTIAAELRLRTYMSNEGQVESMSALSSMSSDTNIGETLEKVFYLSNANQLMRYYYTAMPTKTFISNVIHRKVTKKSSILFDDSPRVKAEVYKSLCDYKNYKKWAEHALYTCRCGERNTNSDIADSLDNLAAACGKLGDHKMAVSYYEQSLRMRRGFYGKDAEHPDIATSFNILGTAYRDLGDYRKAVSCHEQSLEMRWRIYGEDTAHSGIAASLNNLGNAWVNLGDYRKAVRYHQKSLKMTRKIYGENAEHPGIALSLNNLGVACGALGDYKKAVSYHEQSLRMSRRIYGENTVHSDIGMSLENLGIAWVNLGDHRKAVSYYQKSLQMKLKIYGEDAEHPDISRLLNNLGTAYCDLGDYKQAVSYYEQSLEMRRRIYGKNTVHSDIATSLNNLGIAWGHLTDYRKAVSYKEQSLQMKRSIYGKNTVHPDIASSRHSLGVASYQLGDYRKAVSYFEQSLQMKESIYGENTPHPDIAVLLDNLGRAWSALGDYRKAFRYCEQSLQMRRRIYGENTAHTEISSSLNNLGAVWYSLGDYGEAMRYYEQSLQMDQSIHGKKTAHPNIATSLTNLGNACSALGDHRQAVRCYEQSLQMNRIIHGGNTAYPDIAVTLNNLGAACCILGDNKNSLRYYEESLQVMRSIYGENTAHPDIADSLNNLGTAYIKLGDYRKAVSYFEQSLQMMKNIHGETIVHPDTAVSFNNVGVAWRKLGDYRKAVSNFEQSLKMKKGIYGENTAHPDIASSLNNLGNVCSDLGEYRKAFNYYEQSLQMKQIIYGENTAHLHIASSLTNLGTACVNLGEYSKAVNYFEQSLDMKQTIYGESTAHPDIANALSNLAVAWQNLGDSRKAIFYHDQAVTMNRFIQERSKTHSDTSTK
ncbi:uncharacterized protein LOC144863736 [Branchiostoma floridae x Branchiostoma japonicum]